ncbi:MAG: type II toxin-antitoxin system VapC family toxin [Marmoricola sp.]
MILLDTHVVIWAAEGVPRLGPRTRSTIAQSRTKYVSAVTHAELAIKAGLSKLRVPQDLPQRLASGGFDPLPLSAEHAEGMRSFPELVGHDPFNRMLVAQAYVDGLTLLTADTRLLDLDRPWIIDATT